MNSAAASYVAEWEAKTGRAKSDIYIPEALRVPTKSCAECIDKPARIGSDFCSNECGRLAAQWAF